ncbi:MAG: pyridoxamine 5'-phosphate oxidase [Nitrosarchaeum sp.]|nr:pyridoxamine 5'-phosphate oxidase family protein [Nitrosarchaeum sp.]PHY08929.1 MAG: pyridoxamine 5'-phosphate oxidase [Nitrosarchaeum sp.]
MIEFTKTEEDFLQSMEEARIATSHDDIPHVKPVSFIYHTKNIFIATDYKTRTLKNLKINPKVSVTIDIYQSGKHKAVCIQGKAKVLENGQEFQEIYKIFEKKFAWVRNEPWKENEAPFIKIIATNKTSWGIT